jgi:hypothetical protein
MNFYLLSDFAAFGTRDLHIMLYISCYIRVAGTMQLLLGYTVNPVDIQSVKNCLTTLKHYVTDDYINCSLIVKR